MRNFIVLFCVAVLWLGGAAAKSCCELPQIAHGAILQDKSGNSHNIHAARKFTCSSGYEVAGSSSITCSHKGIWIISGYCHRIGDSITSPPFYPPTKNVTWSWRKCTRTQPKVENGRLVYAEDGRDFWIDCRHGYTLCGKDPSVVCSVKSGWSKFKKCITQESCNKRKQSSTPATWSWRECRSNKPKIENGRIVATYQPKHDGSGDVNVTFYVWCQHGYTLCGANNIGSCGKAGWSHVEKKCIALESCKTLKQKSVKTTTTLPANTTKYKANPCVTVPRVQNGRLSWKLVRNSGLDFTIKCDPGFTVCGKSDLVTCDKRAGWSRVGSCIGQEACEKLKQDSSSSKEICQQKPQVRMGHLVKTDKPNVYTIACKHEFMVCDGKITVTCSEKTGWSPVGGCEMGWFCAEREIGRQRMTGPTSLPPTPPVKDKCDTPPHVFNGNVIRTHVKGRFALRCNNGYQLVGGRNLITCSKERGWSIIVRRCSKKPRVVDHNIGSSGGSWPPGHRPGKPGGKGYYDIYRYTKIVRHKNGQKPGHGGGMRPHFPGPNYRPVNGNRNPSRWNYGRNQRVGRPVGVRKYWRKIVKRPGPQWQQSRRLQRRWFYRRG